MCPCDDISGVEPSRADSKKQNHEYKIRLCQTHLLNPSVEVDYSGFESEI